MRFMLCLLSAVVFAAVECVAQVQRTSGATPGAAVRAGKAGLNVAPNDARGEMPPKQAEEKVVTRMTFNGPPSGWGIVKANSPYYSAEGKRLGEVPGGSVFTYASVKTSSKNMVMEAKIKREDGAWFGPFFLDVAEVVIFSGTLEDMPEELLADIQAYFSVKSKIARRKQFIEETEQAKNPHFASAKQAQEKYLESVKTANDLAARAEKQVGTAKSKTLDQLRALKYEQAKLQKASEEEAARYKGWKAANPVTPERFAADAELAALEEQLKKVRVKVERVLPGE